MGEPNPSPDPAPLVLVRASSAERESIASHPESRDLAMIGFPLRKVLSQSYEVHPRDVVAVGEVNLDGRYDVLLYGAAGASRAELRSRLARELPPALGLIVRREERTVPINRLRRAPSTPALEPSQARPPHFEARPGRVEARAAEIRELEQFLRWRSPRPIVDETGLDDRYDFILEWDPSAGAGGVFLALHDIGLAIVPDRGPAPFLVVERAP